MEYAVPIVLVVAVVIYLLVRKKGGEVIGVIKPKGGQQAIIDSLTVKTKGMFGPTVFSQQILTEPVLAGIADAFDERVAKAKSLGWTQGLIPDAYTIYVFPSVRDTDLDGNYSPVFAVFLEPGDAYIGSEYDHGTNGSHWIYASENVLQDANGDLTDTFAIAASNDRAYTQRVVSYALDHILARKNDMELYERTKDHSKGGSHPIW